MRTAPTTRLAATLAGALALTLAVPGVAHAGGAIHTTMTRGNWLFTEHWSGGVVPSSSTDGSTVHIDHDFILESAGAADTLYIGVTRSPVFTMFDGSLDVVQTVVGLGADARFELMGGHPDLGRVRLGNITHSGRLEAIFGQLSAQSIHVGGLLADPAQPEGVLDIRGNFQSITVAEELTVSDVSAIRVVPRSNGAGGLPTITTHDATFEAGSRIQVVFDYPAQVGDAWDVLTATGTITGTPQVEVHGPYDVILDTSTAGTLRLVVASFEDSGNACDTAPQVGYGFGLGVPGGQSLVGYINAGPAQACTGGNVVADRWYRTVNTTNQVRTNTVALSDAQGGPVPGLSLEMWDGCGGSMVACDAEDPFGNPPTITYAARQGESFLFRVVDELGMGLPFELYGNSDGTFFESHGASAGEHGEPWVYPSGALVAGAQAEIEMMNAPRNAPVLAFLSLDTQPVNVLGGTLVATPTINQLLFFTNAAGYVGLETTWPAGMPPSTEFWVQFICQDLTVPDGLILSNAVRGRTPSETAFLPN